MPAVGAEPDARAPSGGSAWRVRDLAGRRRWRRATPGYSRFVTTSKFLLPVAASILIVLVLAWPQLQFEESRFRMGFATLSLKPAEDTAMLNPRYVGADKNGRPFAVTADLAKSPSSESAIVALEMPKADMMLDDGSWVVLTAETGAYHRSTQVLDLAGSVSLFHDSGLEFQTATARIDLAAGTAAGSDPVQGQGPFGDLSAEGFRLLRQDRIIHFTGKARLVLYPSAKQQAP